MNDIDPEQARAALDSIGRARDHVAAEIGLPRAYWWILAAAWLVLGVIGAYGPAWAATVATIAFGVGHSIAASRLLEGRRRTAQLQVSREVADRRVPVVVVAMLLALVALTVAAALALDADGARHPQLWAAVFVAAVVGFGGPEILRTLRRRLGA
ncbi:hypothetical protein [Williamsia herbipolensis]|uniref:hypothetical protein n=1 Tax=Williamsia herbipolensis TaxID=1603258 RepID=UPI0005F7C42D|nr:hypothetical protein [Williamsia herbipolensis]